MFTYIKQLYQHLFCPPCIYSMAPEQSAEIRRLTELANKISKGEYITDSSLPVPKIPERRKAPRN